MRSSLLLVLLSACSTEPSVAAFTPLEGDAAEKATPRQELEALKARVTALETQNGELATRLATVETGLDANDAADVAAQDHNNSRSNKTATAVNLLTDALVGETIILSADTDGDGEYDTFTGTGTVARVDSWVAVIERVVSGHTEELGGLDQRVSAAEATLADLGAGAASQSSSIAALAGEVELLEEVLVAVGVLEVDADGELAESALMPDFITGVGESLEAVYGFFEAWPDMLDPWTEEACAADPDSDECAALEDTVRTARERGSGMATGRRTYSPLVTDVGGGGEDVTAEETTVDTTTR